jgi:glutaryl-CoA dehydrogenase
MPCRALANVVFYLPSNARFGIAFGVIGALEEAIQLSREYALQRSVFPLSVLRKTYSHVHVTLRKQFGKPIASFQLVQKKLADANMEAASMSIASVLFCTPIDDASSLLLSSRTCLVRSAWSTKGWEELVSLVASPSATVPANSRSPVSAEMVSLMKRNNCYKATEHTRTLMEIFGGNACSDE